MKRYKYILYILLLVCSLAIVLWLNRPGSLLTIHVLDIGQGDSIYLRLPNSVDILVDVGPDDRTVKELGKYMPIGDRTIELVIITHNHLDHIGGFSALTEQFKIGRVWLSGATETSSAYNTLVETIRVLHIASQTVRAGATLNWPSVKLVVLHPAQNLANQDPSDQHEATIVAKLSYKYFCILLTGDLNFQQEADVIATADQLHESLSCPSLKVSHHGSNYGTSQTLLDRVQPQIALISVGEHNLYHHPGVTTLERLTSHHIRIFRTDQNGTISLYTNGEQFWTKTEH